MDSLVAMPKSSCILYGFSGGMLILSGSSAIGRSPFPNLRRHFRVLQGLVLANSHVFTVFEDSEHSPIGLSFIDAAVMGVLKPLWMPM